MRWTAAAGALAVTGIGLLSHGASGAPGTRTASDSLVGYKCEASKAMGTFANPNIPDAVACVRHATEFARVTYITWFPDTSQCTLYTDCTLVVSFSKSVVASVRGAPLPDVSEAQEIAGLPFQFNADSSEAAPPSEIVVSVPKSTEEQNELSPDGPAEVSIQSNRTLALADTVRIASQDGTISVTVLDSTGDPLPNIELEVFSVDDGLLKTTDTNSRGVAVITLPADEYIVLPDYPASYTVPADHNAFTLMVAEGQNDPVQVLTGASPPGSAVNESDFETAALVPQVQTPRRSENDADVVLVFYDNAGIIMPDMLVGIYEVDGSLLRSDTTDSEGVVSFTLPADEYIVLPLYPEGREPEEDIGAYSLELTPGDNGLVEIVTSAPPEQEMGLELPAMDDTSPVPQQRDAGELVESATSTVPEMSTVQTASLTRALSAPTITTQTAAPTITTQTAAPTITTQTAAPTITIQTAAPTIVSPQSSGQKDIQIDRMVTTNGERSVYQDSVREISASLLNGSNSPVATGISQDGQGSFTFSGLPSDIYTVVLDQQNAQAAGQIAGIASDGAPGVGTSSISEITLRVFTPSSGGGQEAISLPVSGSQVFLLDANGTPLDSVVVGTDGTARFTNVPMGVYGLSVDLSGEAVVSGGQSPGSAGNLGQSFGIQVTFGE